MIEIYFKDTMHWERVLASGVEQPPPRAGHTATLVGGVVVVFGTGVETDEKLIIYNFLLNSCE